MTDYFDHMIILPTPHEGEFFVEQTSNLDGSDFIFRYEWNDRDNHWFLTLKTSEGIEIKGCVPMRVVKGLWPLWRVRDTNKPTGQLLVLSEASGDPGFKTLGTQFFMAYIPKADWDEWIATIQT